MTRWPSSPRAPGASAAARASWPAQEQPARLLQLVTELEQVRVVGRPSRGMVRAPEAGSRPSATLNQSL